MIARFTEIRAGSISLLRTYDFPVVVTRVEGRSRRVTGGSHGHTAGHTAPVDPVVITTTQETDMNLEARMNEMAHQVDTPSTRSASAATTRPTTPTTVSSWSTTTIASPPAHGRVERGPACLHHRVERAVRFVRDRVQKVRSISAP